MATATSKKEDEIVYTKDQIVRSQLFADDRDVIVAILPNGTYTAEEVEKRISAWKGKVVK